MRHGPPMWVFPPLRPPQGMTQVGGGGGGGGGGTATAQATLLGDLSPEAIESHYRAQLETAGWRVGEHAASGRWAWSTWEFTGERQAPWMALLTVVATPGVERQRQVYLQASTSGRGGQGGSWSTMTAVR